MGINSIGASHNSPVTVDEPDDQADQELRRLGEDNGVEVLSAALSGEKLGKGAQAKVYRIPGYSNLVFRTLRQARRLNEQSLKTSQVTFQPVDWPESIRRNSRLGIPLAFAKMHSPGIFRGEDSAQSKLSGLSDMLVLRRVHGSTPVESYRGALEALGQAKNRIGSDIIERLYGLYKTQRNEEQGLLAARYFLKKLESGESFEVNKDEAARNGFQCPDFDIRMSEYGPSRTQPNFNPGVEFIAKYREFAKAYLQRLEDIGAMPQKAFDDAIKLIAEINDTHDVELDLSNCGNVIVDVQAGKFGFVDLFPHESGSQGTDSLVRQFGDCLFGLGLLRKFGSPQRLIYLEPDVARLRQSRDLIISKLEKASPGLGPSLHERLSGY